MKKIALLSLVVMVMCSVVAMPLSAGEHGGKEHGGKEHGGAAMSEDATILLEAAGALDAIDPGLAAKVKKIAEKL